MRLTAVLVGLMGLLAVSASANEVRAPPLSTLLAAPNHYHIAREDPAQMIFDDDGVRMIAYEWGNEHNPLSVARLASASYAHGDYPTFWTQIGWLIENAVIRDGFTVWEYDFDYEPYHATAPWISGMAQGEIMVVLCQAHSLTGDEHYMEMAKGALQSFAVPVESGGVLRSGSWYEEYAAPGSDFTKVLNGHMFALEGLEWYQRYTGDELAGQLFEHGLDTVRRELPYFDLDGWGAYDGSGWPASSAYNGIMVRQLWHFWETTGDQIFFDYASRWQAGTQPAFVDTGP